MTGITIRRAERDQVVALLEDDTYASAADLADALIRKVVTMLSERDAHAVQLRAGEAISVVVAPFWNVASAKALARSLGGSASVHKLSSVAGMSRLMDPSTHRKKSHCEECTHPMFAHGFTNKKGCVVRKCRCKIVA
jgi:hypothetical protein